MSDDGRFERDCAALYQWRSSEDQGKFRIGLRTARMTTFYGGAVIEHAAREANYSAKTLYARRDVAIFMCQIAPALSESKSIFSVRRFLDENPEISYTHLRIALPKSGWDIEEAIESLLAIANGDTDFEAWLMKQEVRPLILPMTTAQFGQYVSWLRGGKPRPRPIFEGRGTALDVLRNAWNEIKQRGQGNKEVKLTIKEQR